MSENYGFFNANKNSDGTYDRTYDATDFATFFARFVGNGVYKGYGLNVVPKSGLTVTLKKGSAFVNGYWYELTEDMDFTFEANSTSSNIVDVVAITLDKTNRMVYARKKENTGSGQPERSDNVYDLIVARITLGVGVGTITSSMIKDTRADSNYCGFVTGLIKQIDVTDLYNQMQGQFDDWFADIQDKLTSDVAGSLQKQIDDLKSLQGGQTAVIDATTDEDGGLYITKTMNFPDGFTKENCYVKSFGLLKVSGTGVGENGAWYYGALADYDVRLGSVLRSSGITIRAESTNSFNGRYKWKVVLEKM